MGGMSIRDHKMTVLPSAEKLDAPDRDAIVRIVQLYVDGFTDCDVDKFIQAFTRTRGFSSLIATAPYTRV